MELRNTDFAAGLLESMGLEKLLNFSLSFSLNILISKMEKITICPL